MQAYLVGQGNCCLPGLLESIFGGSACGLCVPACDWVTCDAGWGCLQRRRSAVTTTHLASHHPPGPGGYKQCLDFIRDE